MGLFASSNFGEELIDDPRLGMRVLNENNADVPVGIEVKIAGLAFCVVMNDSAKGTGARYRPGAIEFTSANDGRQSLVALGWHHPHPSNTMQIDWLRATGAAQSV
jgi:hypothetical protein